MNIFNKVNKITKKSLLERDKKREELAYFNTYFENLNSKQIKNNNLEEYVDLFLKEIIKDINNKGNNKGGI